MDLKQVSINNALPRMPHGVTSSMTSSVPPHTVPSWKQLSNPQQHSHAQNKQFTTVSKVKLKKSAFAKLRYQIKMLKAENRLLKSEQSKLTEQEVSRKMQIIADFQAENGNDKTKMTSQSKSMTPSSPSHPPRAPGPTFGGDGRVSTHGNVRPVHQDKKPRRFSAAMKASTTDKLTTSMKPHQIAKCENHKSDDSGYDNSTDSNESDHEQKFGYIENKLDTDATATPNDVEVYYNKYNDAYPLDDYEAKDFINTFGMPTYSDGKWSLEPVCQDASKAQPINPKNRNQTKRKSKQKSKRKSKQKSRR